MHMLRLFALHQISLQLGDSYVKADCSAECTCTVNEDMVGMECVPLTCDENAVCEVRENVQDCYCMEGYRGDGTECEGR